MTMTIRKLGRSLFAVFVMSITLLSLNLLTTQIAHAASTTYYINNNPSICNDSAGSGTSQSTPWCDFTPVNSKTFGPGDQILLARGDTWNQEMDLAGTGTSTNWITVSAYGSGNNPKILRDGNDHELGIKITNPDYWSFNNLEVGNAAVGILVTFTSLGHEGLQFNNLYVHNNEGIEVGTGLDAQGTSFASANAIFNSAGIYLTDNLPSNPSGPAYVIENVLFAGITGRNNLDSVAIDWDNDHDLNGSETTDNHGAQDVTMRNLNFQDDNNGSATANGTNGCPDGLRLWNVTTATIIDSSFNDEAACYTTSGTAAIFTSDDSDVNFANDVVTNTPNTGSPDQTGFDYEQGNTAVDIWNSYFGGNAGAGIENLEIHPGYHNTSIDYSSNTFVNNGQNSSGCQGSLCQAGTDNVPTGTIENNIYDEAHGFMSTGGGGSWSGFTTSHNLSVSSPANAGHDFSGTQGGNNWSYEYSSDGTTWSAFPSGDYTSASNLWTDGSNQISQFEMFPSSGQYVARKWVAPTSGTISMRGRVLNPGGTNYGNQLVTTSGDPMLARITDNGATIWPASGWQTIQGNDEEGVQANLDAISVNAGDSIQFEVEQASGDQNNPAADTLSWNPSLGFTSFSSSSSLVNGSFEAPNVSASPGYQINPTDPTGAWTFESISGSANSGVVTQNNTTWGTPAAPDGTQMALLQQQGTITQTVNFSIAGTYVLGFEAARRTSYGGQQTFNVLVDGTNKGTFSPTAGSFAAFNSNAFTVSAGNHTIEFQGTTTTDCTDFIDAVQLELESPLIVNGSFEHPDVSASPGYQIDPTDPTGAWTFESISGSANSGVVTQNNTTWGTPVAPDGTQMALLQQQGTITQTINFPTSGTYVLSFEAARRTSFGGQQTFNVLVDGTNKGTFSPTSESFAAFSSNAFTVSAGNHTIEFQGTTTTDCTDFIDAVQLG